ncbi:MAG: hypothetical protein RID91_21930 [Azospirillaceae bacterium]
MTEHDASTSAEAAAPSGTVSTPRPDAAVRAGAAAERFTGLVTGSAAALADGARRAAGWRPTAPRLPRLRLLPAMIFVSVLMLGIRMGDLWTELTVDGAFDAGRPSLAQEAEVEDPAAPDGGEEGAAAMAEADPPAGDAPDGATTAQGDADGATGGQDAVSRLIAGLEEGGIAPDQLALLEDLAGRRAELDRRARALDEREAMLAASERRLDEKMAEIAAARDEIRSLLGELDAQSAERIRNLAGIYESMRPGDAAAIFNGLEMPVILAVMEHMRQQKSAPILAGMNPVRAREVTAELAKRRDLAAEVADPAAGAGAPGG